jgi:hypothetical protein
MMRTCRGFLLVFAGLVAGCENPRPSISAVTPNQAYSSDSIVLMVVGDNFVPASIVDPDQGRRIALSEGFSIRVTDGTYSIDLADVAWLSPHQVTGYLAAQAALELRPGLLDVEVVDPRGQRDTLQAAFHELGPDQVPPAVVFDSPAAETPFAPGMLLRGSFHATEVSPGRLSSLGWTYLENGRPPAEPVGASCLPPAQATTADCAFQAKISSGLAEGDVVTIVASAQDSADPPNLTQTQLPIPLRAVPTLTSIWPARGGTMGGTDIIVTGTGFVPGTTASVDGVPLFPNGGIVVDSNTLSGHVPPHPEGAAPLRVHTPLGDAAIVMSFHYLDPPKIDGIMPAVGSAAGGTPVTVEGSNFTRQTQIYFGSTLARALPLAKPSLTSAGSIAGTAPAGSGPTTVWAFDPELGFSELPDGFTWSAP